MARAIETTADSGSEAQALQERLDALEGERAEEVARAHDALAAAQDRSYWLDRWHVDLNALMRKPGAGLLRAAFRALRALYRLFYDTRNRTGKAVDGARGKVAGARERLEREGSADAGVPAEEALPFERLRVTPVSDALARAASEDATTVDPDDPRALAALGRADAIVGALTHVGRAPGDGQVWLGSGALAADVLALLRTAYPGLECRDEGHVGETTGSETTGTSADAAESEAAGEDGEADTTTGKGVDVVFATSGWIDEPTATARLSALHREVKPGGALLIGAERGAQAIVTPGWLAATATPRWRVALYLPGGLEGDRDLYVLERA